MAADSCWAYLVVSSEQQAETVDYQQRWAEQTAAQHGWHITRIFRGVSTGKSGARKLLESLLTELEATPKAQRPHRVLMTRLDRTGRGLALEPLASLARIYQLGTIVHSREDGDVTIERASDTIRPILRILTGAMENEARRDKSLSTHARKKREGKHAGHAPYGIVLVEGKPRPYEPEARIVREIFERRLQGWGTHRLARYAATHAPPKKKADGSTRKMKWGENSIARMLACSTYKGIVVDADLFNAVQAIKFAPIDKTAKHNWPLRGAIRCTCGHMLTTCKSGNAKYRVRYYICRNVAVHRDRYPFHNANAVEAQFVELLAHLEAHPEAIADYSHVTVDIQALRTQRATLERDHTAQEQRRKRVWELAEEAGISASELRTRLDEIAAEQARLVDAIGDLDGEIALEQARMQRNASVTDALAGMSQAWPKADVEMQREVAKAVSDYVGGLYLAPTQARGASKSVLIYGRNAAEA